MLIRVRKTMSRKVEKKGGKTQYRRRSIPMTEAIRRCVQTAMAASPSDFVFTMADGSPVNFRVYRDLWNEALEASEVTNKTPYSTRHSLVQWDLVAGVTAVRLVEIMGHRDKQMIFGVYGRYRHGLGKEAGAHQLPGGRFPQTGDRRRPYRRMREDRPGHLRKNLRKLGNKKGIPKDSLCLSGAGNGIRRPLE